jgi:hypothetical protein
MHPVAHAARIDMATESGAVKPTIKPKAARPNVGRTKPRRRRPTERNDPGCREIVMQQRRIRHYLQSW